MDWSSLTFELNKYPKYVKFEEGILIAEYDDDSIKAAREVTFYLKDKMLIVR